MKKLTKKQIENLKTGALIILGIIVFIGVIYIASEKTGDHSLDKDTSNQTYQSSDEANPLLEEGEELKEEEQKELTSISFNDLKNALSNHEKKIIMLGTEWCGWCNYQKPILKHVAYKYDIEIHYLNLENLTEDEQNELAELHESLASFGTPTFMIIEDGKVSVVDTNGARGTKSIEQLLVDNGFISQSNE